MTNPSIFTRSEAESDTVYNPKSGFHTNVAVTGEHLQMIWAKLEHEGDYALHSHPHEQLSVMIHGRMRLTVGDDVRDMGPGDMWYAPVGVEHGGEVLGTEPVIFIDVYAPPSSTITDHVKQLKAQTT